jgi:hypothetical protein
MRKVRKKRDQFFFPLHHVAIFELVLIKTQNIRSLTLYLCLKCSCFVRTGKNRPKTGYIIRHHTKIFLPCNIGLRKTINGARKMLKQEKKIVCLDLPLLSPFLPPSTVSYFSALTVPLQGSHFFSYSYQGRSRSGCSDNSLCNGGSRLHCVGGSTF